MADQAEIRIALFSDVHGNLAALQAVLRALASVPRVDHVVVAGDHLQGGPHPTEVWQLLCSSACILIRGNEDEVLLGNGGPAYIGNYGNAFRAGVTWTRQQLGSRILTDVATLPDRWRVTTPAGDLLVVHSSPRSTHDRAGGAHNDLTEVEAAYSGTGATAIAFGHFHRNFVRQTPFGLLVNVASVGLPLDNHTLASFTVLTGTDGGWIVEQRHVEYDPAPELAAARERGMPPWVPDPETLE
jgi:predicted phosphodiesterase